MFGLVLTKSDTDSHLTMFTSLKMITAPFNEVDDRRIRSDRHVSTRKPHTTDT